MDVEVLEVSKAEFPVLCEIDGTGYLKHHLSGTYLYDEDENLFELTQEEIEEAEEVEIIKLISYEDSC